MTHGALEAILQTIDSMQAVKDMDTQTELVSLLVLLINFYSTSSASNQLLFLVYLFGSEYTQEYTQMDRIDLSTTNR